jgi:sigma-E factor negative regulatory protein RseB
MVCVSAIALEQVSAVGRVQRMMVAVKSLDYDGVFIYQHAHTLNALRVVHRGSGDAERERIISLSGPSREVIREGHRVTVKLAADHAVLVEDQQPGERLNFGLLDSPDILSTRYQFQLENTDRIAGRTAQVVGISARLADRYAYRLWIDEASGLLLKCVILDLDGQALEEEQFAVVTIGVPPTDESLKSELTGSNFDGYVHEDESIPSVTPANGPSNWRVAWLPIGFSQHRDQTRQLSASRQPVRHFVYSDGLAAVSVFIEKLGGDASPLIGDSNLGAVNIFSRSLAGYQITVVGQMPLATIRQIAASVAPQTSE